VVVTSVFVPFGVALLLALLRARARALLVALAALPPALALALLLVLLPGVAEGPLTQIYPWAAGLGVELSFYLDGLSMSFGLLISGIGLLVVIYAAGYFDDAAQLRRFYAPVLAFMGAMLGLVLADNVLTLFVFWELTSITSFLLIGFDPEDDAARAGAMRAFLVTGGGGLALLGGLVLAGSVLGSYELSDWLARERALVETPYYGAILTLVLLGAFTKSAQLPFHFWLPGAMAAPTPISAYLHSATMVKAGIYLLARLLPVLGGTWSWQLVVGGVGTLTLVVGAWLALQQTDLKALLAYGTISQLGALTALLGAGSESAVIAAVVGIWAHAAYKGALFLVVGAVDHESGTRDTRRLRGLWRAMPVTAACAAIAGLSMAGLPPLMGFVGKELVFEAGLPHGEALTALQLVQLALTALGAALTVAYALVAVWGVFFAPGEADTPKTPPEAPWPMLLGPLALCGVSLLGGLAPGLLERSVLTGAVSSVLREEVPLDLALWHGLNTALLLSLVSIGLGAGLYLSRPRWLAWAARHRLYDATLAYERGVTGVLSWAGRITDALQHGRLRFYLATILATLVVLVGGTTLARVPLTFEAVAWVAPRPLEIVTAVLILLATLGTLTARTRLGAIASLSAVGYLIALMFVLLSGPDLALTQLLVETLTLIIFLLAFYFLPSFFAIHKRVAARARDAALSLLVGGTMTLLVLVATTVQLGEPVGDAYLERAYPEAQGRNVVNVILVDFRGFDTLGEIVVLAVAALGIYGLIRLRLSSHDEEVVAERRARQLRRRGALQQEVRFDEPALREIAAREKEAGP
jgi:multicomponent Na+:H+ antiporter subunit A